MDESGSNNTHQENHRLRLGIMDSTALVPLPVIGIWWHVDYVIHGCIAYWVIALILGMRDINLLDICKIVWSRRSKTCHARLKNNR